MSKVLPTTIDPRVHHKFYKFGLGVFQATRCVLLNNLSSLGEQHYWFLDALFSDYVFIFNFVFSLSPSDPFIDSLPVV